MVLYGIRYKFYNHIHVLYSKSICEKTLKLVSNSQKIIKNLFQSNMKAESTRVQQQTMNQTPSQQRSDMSQKSTPYSRRSTSSASSTPHSASSSTPQPSPISRQQAYITPQSSQASLRTPQPSSA